jgi:hypothetical protein
VSAAQASNKRQSVTSLRKTIKCVPVDGYNSQSRQGTSLSWKPISGTLERFGSKLPESVGVASAQTRRPESTRVGRATTGETTLNFAAEWVEYNAVNANPDEAATLCDLRIFVGGKNACRFLDLDEAELENQKNARLTIPAIYLAEGLATDWWSILNSRDWNHRIQRYRTGFALPDIVLRSHGSYIEVASGPHRHIMNPQLQFEPVESEFVSRLDAEAVFYRFIEEVIARLASAEIRDSELQTRWKRVCASRRDEEESVFCEAAGALGLDPYSISEEHAKFIESAYEFLSEEVLLEFLSGLRTETWAPSLIDSLHELDDRDENKSLLPVLSEFELASTETTGHPWAIGYRAARSFRDAMGLSVGDRISYSSLTKKLGASEDFEATPLGGGIRAFVSRSGGTKIHLQKYNGKDALSSARSTNFAFARAVGDAVIFPTPRRSVVNGLHHAKRQAAGRAFAAELLAPIDEIGNILEKRVDVDDTVLADEFDVSPKVVRYQIENRDRHELVA